MPQSPMVLSLRVWLQFNVDHPYQIIIPALIITFLLIPPCFGEDDQDPSSSLTPAQQYANEILAYRLRVVLGQAGDPRSRKEKKLNRKEWKAVWEKTVKDKISFFIQDERPLVIYPENASEVIQEVCPEADFYIILLGENVYLSIYFDKEKDIYPHVRWLYMDSMDIKYSQIQEETDQIAQFISKRLKDHLEDILNERKTLFGFR